MITGVRIVFFEVKLFSLDALQTLSFILSSIVPFWLFYFKWGWKLPLLGRIANKENLNGTWFGQYEARNVCEKKILGQDQIAVVIRQSFFTIHLTSYTNKTTSYSRGESIQYDEKIDSYKLFYFYSQDRRTLRDADDEVTKGATELLLEEEKNQKKLTGDFWTNKRSEGKLQLVKLTSKHFKSFSDIKTFAEANNFKTL